MTNRFGVGLDVSVTDREGRKTLEARIAQLEARVEQLEKAGQDRMMERLRELVRAQ